MYETYEQSQAREAAERTATDAYTLTPWEVTRLLEGAAELEKPYRSNATYVIEAAVHGLPCYDFAPRRVIRRNIHGSDVAYVLKRTVMTTDNLTEVHAYPEVF